MLVDGKKIAKKILDEVKQEVEKLPNQPRLSVIACNPNFETQKYLKMKKAKASLVGIAFNLVEMPEQTTTKEMKTCVNQIAMFSDGVVVQLPLPLQIDKDIVLDSIPPEKDPDGFNYGKIKNVCMSPVVGAIDEISKFHKIEWRGKKVIILGLGRLVGIPAKHYAQEKGAKVEALTKENYSASFLKEADIIISGIGQPHFITLDMVKEGVVVFDAGTSEDNGVLAGDASPDLVKKASLLTPVPGGIGPITIAYLLRNLARLNLQSKRKKINSYNTDNN